MIQLFKNSLKYKDSEGNMQDSGVLFASEKEKEWEHIETITVEEDGIKVIERNQEPDGTPYNFKKMMFFIHHPVTTNEGKTGLKLYRETIDGLSAYLGSGTASLRKEGFTDSVYYAEVIKDILYGHCATALKSGNEYDASSAYIGNFVPRKLVKINAIEYVQYRSLNSFTLPIGTTFEIYAIRA